MKSFIRVLLPVMHVFLATLFGFVLIAACTGDSPAPLKDDVRSSPTTQATLLAPTVAAVIATPSLTSIPPTPISVVGTAGFWENDFTTAIPDTELPAATMIQVHPSVPFHSDVRLNAVDPAYYQYGGKPAGFGFFPRVIRMQKGDLVAVFKEGAHEPVPSGRIVAVRSEDAGATWSDPIVVLDTPNINDSPLGMVQQQDGTILVGGWTISSEASAALYEGWDGFLVSSDDGGRTWRSPTFLRNDCRGWQPAILLSNGSIASLGLCDVGRIDEGLGPQTVPALFFSQTAQEREIIAPDGLGGYDEWSIVETDTPGELAAIFRHQYTGEYYFQATSKDYGKSWNNFQQSDIWFSSWPSRPVLRKMEDGTLVAFYAERKNRRIVAQPSFDGGQTWDASRRIVVMDGGGPQSVFLGEYLSIDSGYPDAAPLGDGRWLAVYYNDGKILGTYFDASSFKKSYSGVRLSREHETSTSTLAAHWSFDGASDTQIVYDQVSGTYNYDKLTGSSYRVPGRSGSGLRLGLNPNNRMLVADSDTLRLPRFFALEAWIFSRNIDLNQAIISKAPAYSLSIRDGRLSLQMGAATFSGKQLLPQKNVVSCRGRC